MHMHHALGLYVLIRMYLPLGTGAAFRILHQGGHFNKHLLNCFRVFARMKPQDKIDCVWEHMQVSPTCQVECK